MIRVKYNVIMEFATLCKALTYRNDLKFSDIYAWANSADPDQTAPRSSLIRVYTVCHSVCIVWTHYTIIEPHSPNFLGVRIFRKFTVLLFLCHITISF